MSGEQQGALLGKDIKDQSHHMGPKLSTSGLVCKRKKCGVYILFN